jgi:hypothetical protein
MNSFDKKIKEKLEQISEVGADMAWQKLQMSLPQPLYMYILKNYTGWALAGLLGTILIFQNIKNDELLKKTAMVATVQGRPDDKTFKINKIDTVFTEKIIYKEKIIYRNSEVKTEFKNKIITANQISDSENLNKLPFAQNEIVVNPKQEKSHESWDQKETSQVAFQENKTETKSNIIEKISNGTIPNLPLNSENDVKTSINLTSDTEIQNSVRTEKANIIEPAINSLPPKIINQENLASDLPKEEFKTILPTVDPLESQNKPADFKRKPRIFNARLGFDTKIKGYEKISFGPILETFIGRQFSFSTGVLFSSNYSKEFKLPIDFNKKTGKRFEDFYKPKLGDKPQEIRDIKIRTSSINVPLQLNYYFPIRYNFNLVTAAGAMLKFNEKDEVIFEGKLPFEERFIKTFENKRESKVLAEFNYSMGIQYSYKRLYFQVLPNFSFPIQKSFFLNEKNRFGIDASVRFSLKK